MGEGPSRKTKLVRAGAATVGGQLANMAVLVGSTMVLARLLDPADFGLLAMVWSLVLFISSFRDFGLPMAALQAKSLDHLQKSALFWINLPIACGVTLFMLVMAPVLAWFYGEPRLLLLTAILSLGVLAPAVSNQHEAVLTRQLRFIDLIKWDLVFRVAGAAVAIGLAWYGAGYWALAAQYLVWQLCRAAAVWLLSGWLPARYGQARLAMSRVRPLVSIGGYLTGYRVLSHAGRDLDRVVVGYFSGAHALGLYDAAFKWAKLPVQQLYTPLLGPAVAALSRAREDTEKFRSNARSLLTPVMGCSIPVLVWAAVAAEPLIRLLLGDKWLEAIPLFQVLCVGGVALASMKTTKWLYVSTGQTKQQFGWGMISSPLFAVAILVGALYGPLGVAIGYASAQWVLLLPALAYCLRRSPLRLRDYLSILVRPLLAATVAGAVTFAALPWIDAWIALRLAASAMLFGVAYTSVWLAMPGGYAAVVDAVKLAGAIRGGGKKPAASPDPD
jgi:PST family polysaccharide transporter